MRHIILFHIRGKYRESRSLREVSSQNIEEFSVGFYYHLVRQYQIKSNIICLRNLLALLHSLSLPSCIVVYKKNLTLTHCHAHYLLQMKYFRQFGHRFMCSENIFLTFLTNVLCLEVILLFKLRMQLDNEDFCLLASK